MTSGARVCPHCGEAPGEGVFCAACGRNLADIEQLPTREEWQAATQPHTAFTDPGEATDAFLRAMSAAGDPGLTGTPAQSGGGFLKRTPRIEGWIVREVERNEEDLKDGHYVPGLVLTPAGVFHRLDNKIRGWGTRDFPRFEHSASSEAIEPPDADRLPGELAVVLAANDVATT